MKHHGELEYLNHQEKYKVGGELTEDKVKITERRAETRIRRAHDKRLMDALNTEQEQAMYLIEAGYMIRVGGIGMKVAGWAKMAAGRGAGNMTESEFQIIASQDYRSWVDACKAEYVSPMMALDIIASGMSATATDRKYRMRNGTAIKNLINALDIYCRMKGWG